MNLFRRTTTVAVTAVALALPAATLVAPAQAAPTSSSDSASDVLAKKKAKKKAKISLKRSASYSHVGQPGVKLTAKVKAKKGKVTFLVNGAEAAKAKVKKGKATYTLPSTNPAGSYKVTAKFKGAKKSTKIRVYNSALQVSATTFTISKAADSWDLPEMTGSVLFKDKPATEGYVDIYQDGRNKEGSSSPFYCCMTSVADNGTFRFAGSTFLGRVKDAKQPGTYTYQAFYTDGPAFADYIYSTPITVVVTP